MRQTLSLCLLAALAACRTSNLGACTGDAQCPQGSVCDTAAAVCVAKPGACLPACDANHLCNPTTLACDAVVEQVTVTSPLANAFASGTLQATATARAPGGVSAVRFDLSRGATVVATAAATVSPTDPSRFSASIPLASVADGAASLTATVTAAAGNATSAAVAVTVDQTAPVIALQTDFRLTFFGAGQTATVAALITDATAGVQDSTVALLISGHAAVPGVPGAGGTYTFAVLIDDSIVAAGASVAVHFQIVATDKAGQLATLSGNPAEVIQADRDAPAITALTYAPAPFNDGAGHLFFGAGAPVSVQATIADGAGVTALCLRLAGETGACQHPASGTGPVYTFSLPRPAASQDGTAATLFTLEADDTLAASLTGASQLEHQTRSAQIVYFDYTGPSISVSADTAPYARTATPIPVSAFIADPSGVPDGGVFLNGVLAPSSRDGGLFVFQLDPRGKDAGTEGAYTFQVSAADRFNNVADAGGTRVVDDAPPTLSVRVFKGSTDPVTPGVTYPAAVANTGWTGSTFIYSDTVHVKGTLNDLSGIGAAVLHVDGIDLDGGVSIGAARSLGCAASATSCTFDVQVALNDLDAGNGVFHTGMRDAGIAGAAMPVGFLSLTIDASDDAGTPTHTPAIHASSTASPARATRFLWAQTLPGSAVSGLAVHPDGDLIATLDGGAGDTVFDLAADQLLPPRWSYGSDAGIATGAQPIGSVTGPPAIGTGGVSARIYVASTNGNFFAIEANGTRAWAAITPANFFAVGPAVAQATISGAMVDEVIEPDGVGGSSNLWSATGDSVFTGVASDERDFHSSPLILNGSVFFASQSPNGGTTHLTKHSIAADGTLGASVPASANGGAPYYGIITDGTNLFAAINATTVGTLQQLDQNFVVSWTSTLTTSGFSAEPTIGIDAKVYASDFGSHLATYDPLNNGSAANVATLAGVSLVPLQGSDGHLYLPRKTGLLYAYAGSALSWFFDPPNAVLREATMDCNGRLFVASGPTIYAFVTDDRGLADTAWPAMRRDSRNTGNAGLPRYGSRTIAGCTQ